MMQAKVELHQSDIQEAIRDYIENHLRLSIPKDDIKVEVKSKQNYRSEWEEAAIRCSFSAPVI